MAKKKQTEKIDWTNRNKSQAAKCHQENYIFKEQIFFLKKKQLLVCPSDYMIHLIN